ncbi:phosphoesterase [Bacteroides sp. CR5/BHMF/2]|nr:phosphoesterase [Bacteroides sp. CR5/BHMF/2]
MSELERGDLALQTFEHWHGGTGRRPVLSRSSQTLDVLLAVHDALLTARNMNIDVILANGNHDLVNQEAVRGYCHIYDQHDNVLVIDEYHTLSNPEWSFMLHVIPYFPEDGSFTGKLNEVIENELSTDKQNYLYIHEGINNALSRPAENELPVHIFSDFDRVFVGHYHNRCTVAPNIEYIGSSRQHNFGEDEEKGYTVLYGDGTAEFIKNHANRRFMVLDVPDNKVDIHLTDRLEELKEDGRYKVKVRIHSSLAGASAIDRNRLLEAGAGKVEIVTEEVHAVQIAGTGLLEKFDGGLIRDNYRRFCTEKGINEELGLSYLKSDTSCGN